MFIKDQNVIMYNNVYKLRWSDQTQMLIHNQSQLMSRPFIDIEYRNNYISTNNIRE